MRVEVVPAGSVPTELIAEWSRLELADPDLASPFFRPEFSALVAAVRPDAFVAVIEDAGEIVGFLPFQRDRFRVGWPIGGQMSNYHGVIGRAGVAWDPVELVRGCGLIAWQFDHLPTSQAAFAAFGRGSAESPYLDLAGGYEGYAAARRAAGSRALGKIAPRAAHLERDLGPVRFEAIVRDRKVLATLLRWKHGHHVRTEREDVLQLPWVSALLDAIFEAQPEPGADPTSGVDFAGMLSALYAGDRLVAAHLGLRSRTVWHYYVTSYDIGLKQYGPGLVMLVAMARSAPDLGIRTIDLGKGDQEFKDHMATGRIPLAEGSVDVPSLQNRLRQVRLAVRSLLRRSPVASPVREAFRLARRRGWLRE